VTPTNTTSYSEQLDLVRGRQRLGCST